MSTESRGPRHLKGAIVAIDVASSARRTIVFQYNPSSISRSLQPRRVGAEEGRPAQDLRFSGAPVEELQVEVTLDAADQLEVGDGQAEARGLHPQIAALEVLLYPDSRTVVRNNRLHEEGMIEVGPFPAPLTLFLWGKGRVMPVELTGISVQEDLFDANLNPLQATVSLSMRSLSYSDLAVSHPGHHLFLAHQQRKELHASLGLRGDGAAATGVDVGEL